MATYSYLRMSTSGQDLEKNKAEILKFANTEKLGNVEFVSEICSGTVSWKDRKLKGLFDSMVEGENLIVSEMSRLGRSMLDVMEILALATERGIKIFSVKGGFRLDGSIQSKVLAFAFSLAAEIEREMISVRTKEALAVAKSRGVRLGRPRGPGRSKLDSFEPEIVSLLKNHSSLTYVADRYGVAPGTLHNWLRKRDIDRFGVKLE